jgi:ADP-heptose:LPS heptosyltransferase
MLMEKAEKIITVDTSIAFILSKLKIPSVNLYSRELQYTPTTKITHLNERKLSTWQIENE